MARILLSRPQHLTAEQVLRMMNRRFPRASRATVFNNLKLFAQKGVVGLLELKSGVTLYDSNTRRHHHAVDSVTGNIVDLELNQALEKRVFAELMQEYATVTGHNLAQSELQITLRGRAK
ncbi:MAG: transcriptional repressor [Leptospirales bacterium]|nr:transcriptional repressor [Leptospirales bacterium]